MSRRTGSDGADFIDIVTFDKLAAVCSEYLTAGRSPSSASSACPSGPAGTASAAPRSRFVADAVQYLGKPAGAPDGGVAEPADKPVDRPALGKSRKAS